MSLRKKRNPDTKEESIFRSKGYEKIAGVDEVGRGAWAGPLVAGAVILPVGFKPKNIRDSKMLTPKERERMFAYITGNAMSWAVAVIEHSEIDLNGIVQCNSQALQQAVKNLHIRPQAVLVDAFNIVIGAKPVKAIIHGDAKVLSIAAASIVAKVVRDELMRDLDRFYPQYEFRKHKGYGTKRHQSLLKKHGPSPIHRMTWAPMRGQPDNKLDRRVAKKNS